MSSRDDLQAALLEALSVRDIDEALAKAAGPEPEPAPAVAGVRIVDDEADRLPPIVNHGSYQAARASDLARDVGGRWLQVVWIALRETAIMALLWFFGVMFFGVAGEESLTTPLALAAAIRLLAGSAPHLARLLSSATASPAH